MPEARYRLFRRASGVFYQQDNETGVQVSLRTKVKKAAEEKLHAANHAAAQPRLNLDLARVYLRAHDAQITERTWAEVMAAYSERGRDTSRERCRRAFSGRDFDPIRALPLIGTKAEDLLKVLASGKPSVNHYLRRLVHHAEDLNWLPWTIMARAAWPKPEKTPKRGVTDTEHARILEAESNVERRDYYEMLWLTGGSQSDIAYLRREDVRGEVLVYRRSKLRADAPPSCLRIGPRLQGLLTRLPRTGSLFPKIAGQKPQKLFGYGANRRTSRRIMAAQSRASAERVVFSWFFGEPPALAQPGEGALDEPAAGQDDEAFLARPFLTTWKSAPGPSRAAASAWVLSPVSAVKLSRVE